MTKIISALLFVALFTSGPAIAEELAPIKSSLLGEVSVKETQLQPLRGSLLNSINALGSEEAEGSERARVNEKAAQQVLKSQAQTIRVLKTEDLMNQSLSIESN